MQEVPSSSGWKAVTPCSTSVELKVFIWTHLGVWLSEKHNTLSLHWLKIRWRHLKTFCPLWNEFNRSHSVNWPTHSCRLGQKRVCAKTNEQDVKPTCNAQLVHPCNWCVCLGDVSKQVMPQTRNLCNPFSTIWTVNCNNLKSVCKWVGVAWALLNCCVVGSSSPACQQLKNSHTWAHNTRAHKWQTKVCVTQFWNCSIIQTSTAIQWCQQKQDQSRSESTKSCFNSCNNCLRLQTCMQNVNTDIDDRHKLENAIKGMTHAVDFRQTSWEERLSDIPEMQIEHTKPHTLRTFNVFLKENIEPESRQDWKSTSVSDHGRMSRTNCETIEWNQKS